VARVRVDIRSFGWVRYQNVSIRRRMVLEITEPVEITFRDADKADQRLDEFVMRDRLVRVLNDLGEFTEAQRRGNFALVAALEFQPRRMYGEPIWAMYWEPLSSATDKQGSNHFIPDVAAVDAEVIQQWSARAQSTRHPLLRARYSDLAWEVPKFRGKDIGVRPEVAMARSAIDGYLDAVEGTLFTDDIYAWNYVERAIELAALISDQGRLQRAKATLFGFRAACEARDRRYAFWRFHEIAWSQQRALELTDTERAEVVRVLEAQLALRSRIEDPQNFDPHLATTAAEELKLWRDSAGQQAEADRAAYTAGEAFEAAAGLASGLTAIAWLTDQLARYRELGDQEAVARIERAIRARAEEAQGEMKRISVPLDVTPEELEAWADRVAGKDLNAGLIGFAAAGVVGRELTERAALDIAQSAIFDHIPFVIAGRDGFTNANIRPDDVEGRAVHRATQLVSQRGPWLNLAWKRIQAKHGADLERLLEWLVGSPCFPPERLAFIREGLTAWLAGDAVKTVHVLVPQVESALRDLLAVLGGAVTKPNRYGGSQKFNLREVLEAEKFAAVPDAVRFHFQVLYQDPRGLNVRNDLAHGILSFELLGLGLANLVVHSIVLIGALRPGPPASDQPQAPEA
jgi:hypothetical protein